MAQRYSHYVDNATLKAHRKNRTPLVAACGYVIDPAELSGWFPPPKCPACKTKATSSKWASV